jgi:hypothetical protein
MEDKYWCEERLCECFVDKNHRCEQWSNTVRIPAGAIKAIRAEALKEAEDIACALWPDQDAIRAAILAGEVKE